MIYASSSSVYSDQEDGKFVEKDTKLVPRSKYGNSKLANEIYAEKITTETNISAVGLRFFSVYGPFGRPDMAYFSFTEALKNNLPITLNNNGNMARDMTFVDDIIDGVEGAVDYLLESRSQIKNEIFNLGNDSPITTLKLLHTLEKKLNKKSEIIHQITKNESRFTHADITKAKKLLGYSPKISFEDGMEQFLNWHKTYEK